MKLQKLFKIYIYVYMYVCVCVCVCVCMCIIFIHIVCIYNAENNVLSWLLPQRSFSNSGTWAHNAHDVVEQLHLYIIFGISINIFMLFIKI